MVILVLTPQTKVVCSCSHHNSMVVDMCTTQLYGDLGIHTTNKGGLDAHNTNDMCATTIEW